MRDRLIELIKEYICSLRIGDGAAYFLSGGVPDLADHLLANGVIVPPVPVGGNMYTLSRGRVKEWKVCFIGINTMQEIKFHLADEGFKQMIEVWNYNIGDIVFLTREQAEKALERSKENG